MRSDGCLLENQEDYEFRHCTFKKQQIKARFYKVLSFLLLLKAYYFEQDEKVARLWPTDKCYNL